MKAISLRQPWADLVMQGKKTLELRTWTVSYRGPLLIHASQTVSQSACQSLGMEATSLTTGALLGTVELTGVVLLDEAAYRERQAEHLAIGLFKPADPGETLYGWQLANPQPLVQPVPYPGRMGLFSVPDKALIGEEMPAPRRGAYSALPTAPDWDGRSAFELRVVPESGQGRKETPYRLALSQRVVEPPPAQASLIGASPSSMRLIAELGGDLLKVVADQILEALRQNGYAATDLSANRRAPFQLAEESGVRLGLLFLAARPITKLGRVEAISLGIRAMTGEELYYWFSKCTANAGAERALKALRLLLAEE